MKPHSSWDFPRYYMERPLRVGGIVSSFRVQHEPGYRFDGEYHDFWEMVCVISGNLGVATENRVMSLVPGQIVFHKPMEFHRLWTLGDFPADLIIMAFEAEGMDAFENKVYHLPYQRITELESLLSLTPKVFILDGAGIRGVKKDPIAGQLFLNGLETFLLHTQQISSVSGQVVQSSGARAFSNITELLSANLDRNFTLAEIASLCHMSVGNLKKVFSHYAGMGVMKYFTSLKMKRAVTLLQSGMTVAEVSNALGYSNQNYFSACFKKEMGKPPSAFKSGS